MSENQAVVLESTDLNSQGIAMFVDEIRAGRRFNFSREAERIISYRFVSEGIFAPRNRPLLWKELSRLELATALEDLYREEVTDSRWPNWRDAALADRLSRIEVSLLPCNKGNTDRYVDMIWKAYGSGTVGDNEQAGVEALLFTFRHLNFNGNVNGYVANQIVVACDATY